MLNILIAVIVKFVITLFNLVKDYIFTLTFLIIMFHSLNSLSQKVEPKVLLDKCRVPKYDSIAKEYTLSAKRQTLISCDSIFYQSKNYKIVSFTFMSFFQNNDIIYLPRSNKFDKEIKHYLSIRKMKRFHILKIKIYNSSLDRIEELKDYAICITIIDDY